jgi:hypothetical protein
MTRRTSSVLVLTAALGIASVVAVEAQQPSTQAAPQGQHGSGCSMMSGGSAGGGMMPMMGMPSGENARAMQMRGEMMKAMGDIMMKYGKMMESSGK